MAYTDEQEQLEALKRFWQHYGNKITTMILVIAIGFMGWRFWQNKQLETVQAASLSYQSLLMSVSQNKPTDIKAKANAIINTYPDTGYAGMANLFLAKVAVSEKKPEEAQHALNWILKNSKQTEIKSLATARLARILLSEKKYDAALVTLKKAQNSESPIYENIKGDIYVALKKPIEAKKAYESALSNIVESDPIYHIIEMKLNDLPKAA